MNACSAVTVTLSLPHSGQRFRASVFVVIGLPFQFEGIKVKQNQKTPRAYEVRCYAGTN
jgi:hypothetical protein